MARILLIISLLLFKFATMSAAGSNGISVDANATRIIEWSGNDISIFVDAQNTLPGKAKASRAPHSHLKKKKGLRVRYMKPDIRYAVPCFIAIELRPFFSDQVFVNSYSCHFCSEHYQLSKLRGPPSLIV